MKINYTLTEIKPRIFFLEFEDHFHCAMMFLRYQEHYESPSPKFRNKSFSIVEYMHWLATTQQTRKFNYADQWGGFNIPSKIVASVQQKGIKDPNQYDLEMDKVYKKCLEKYPRFYLIATSNNHNSLNHEVAHGLFYTVPAYKKKMTQLVNDLPDKFKNPIFGWLKDKGYTPQVYIDETQAYLATGFDQLINYSSKSGYLKTKVKLAGEFEKVFNDYYEVKGARCMIS